MRIVKNDRAYRGSKNNVITSYTACFIGKRTHNNSEQLLSENFSQNEIHSFFLIIIIKIEAHFKCYTEISG